MFQNFPYTDMHQLNLDWIISLIKKFEQEYPSIYEELNKKLSKPVFNPNGNPGDILFSNGNGTTEWKPFDDIAEQDIIQAVNDWLDEHPEATTTVEDGAITVAKLADYTKYLVMRNQSPMITPVYMGDYIEENDYLPSAVVINNNIVYTLDARTRAYAQQSESGSGYLYTFNIANNVKLNKQELLIGHANSMAYDGTNFYVLPIWEYDENGEHETNKIYIYNTSFSNMQIIELPVSFNGVSYDPVSNKVYLKLFYDDHIELYQLNTSDYSCMFVTSVTPAPENVILDRAFNQDLAVYNDEFYISSPYGIILHGKIQGSVSAITDSFMVQNSDSTGRFYMGELEGMEFDSTGHLYAIIYTQMSQGRNAFIVELPVGQAVATSPLIQDGMFSVARLSYTLSAANQDKLYLSETEIRSLQQLQIKRNNPPRSVVISGNVIDDWFIRIDDRICIIMDGTYTTKHINIVDQVKIYTFQQNQRMTFTATDYPLQIEADGELVIGGFYPIEFSTPNMQDDTNNNFIKMSYDCIARIMTDIISVENYKLKIGNKYVRTNQTYCGTTEPLAFKTNLDNNDNITWSVPNDGNTYFTKSGNVYDLSRGYLSGENYSDGTLIATLAAEHKPTKSIYATMFNEDTSKPVNGGIFISATNGKITYYGDTLSNIKTRFHAVWIK